MKKQLYEMLWADAVADRKKALLSLDLLSDHPAGIGDHSTDDYWKNSKQALELLVDADDKLNCLRKYFKEEHDAIQNTNI